MDLLLGKFNYNTVFPDNSSGNTVLSIETAISDNNVRKNNSF